MKPWADYAQLLRTLRLVRTLGSLCLHQPETYSESLVDPRVLTARPLDTAEGLTAVRNKDQRRRDKIHLARACGVDANKPPNRWRLPGRR